MDEDHDRLAEWVALEVLPHEGIVRGWLTRRWGHLVDVDDVIQEAYCRIAGLDSTRHIRSGRSYLFTTAQSIIMDGLRRAKVANTRAMTEIDANFVMDEAPLADRALEARQELERVRRILDGISDMGRRVIEMRRLQGLSQREAAARLGVSEHVVENHMTRALRKVRAILAEERDMQEPPSRGVGDRED